MAVRTDLPKVKPLHQPTIFNKEMVNDAFSGNVIGWLTGGVVALTSKRFEFRSKESYVIAMVGTALGAITGGLRGKGRMQHEQVHGKTVKDPSYFNDGAWTGLLLGSVASDITNIVKLESRNANNLLTLGSFVAAPVIGGLIGKNRMEHEFNQAVALKEQQQFLTHTHTPQASHVHVTVAPAYATSSIDADTANQMGTVVIPPAVKIIT